MCFVLLVLVVLLLGSATGTDPTGAPILGGVVAGLLIVWGTHDPYSEAAYQLYRRDLHRRERDRWFEAHPRWGCSDDMPPYWAHLMVAGVVVFALVYQRLYGIS
jgi:hypothetical protein